MSLPFIHEIIESQRDEISLKCYYISKGKLLSLQKFSLHIIFQGHICENFNIKFIITEKYFYVHCSLGFIFMYMISLLFEGEKYLSSVRTTLCSFQSMTVLFQTPFQMLYFYNRNSRLPLFSLKPRGRNKNTNLPLKQFIILSIWINRSL